MKHFISAILLFLCIASYGQFGVLVGNFSDDDIVAEWLFSENYLDTEGDYDGTNNGSTFTTDRFSRIDSAVAFNSAENDYVSTPLDLSSLEQLSISVWVHRTSTSDKIGSGGQGNDGGHQVYGPAFWNDGNIYVEISDTSVSSGNSFGSFAYDNINNWNHAVMVYDGTASTNSEKLKLYVNDTLRTLSFPRSIPSSTGVYDIEDFQIGRQQGATGYNYFNGNSDDIRIYFDAISAEKVHELFIEGGWPTP